MNIKEIIEKIKKDYKTTITKIADDLNLGRGQIYSFMKMKDGDKQREFIGKLEKKFPKSFKQVVSSVDPSYMTMEDQSMPAAAPKGSKYITPTKFLVMRNLTCVNMDYFMKIPLKHLEKNRPDCPLCGGEMLTRKERKERGLEL